MRRQKKQAESDEPPGAPDWMVTFSDCMTLLLTFFVLLLSFSSFDENTFRNLRVIFAKNLPSVKPQEKRDKDALLKTRQIEPKKELNKGSEKPTLERGKDDNLKEETEFTDFRSRKVFLFSSRKVFWGKGTLLSTQGCQTLDTMASFLKEIHSRIVISEKGPSRDRSSKDSGLARSWKVLKYFTDKHGLNKDWFSISSSGTVFQEGAEDGKSAQAEKEANRVLEIVLLERSIYN